MYISLVFYNNRYNSWLGSKRKEESIRKEPDDPEDKLDWEEEEQRLDREWYNMGEGIKNQL